MKKTILILAGIVGFACTAGAGMDAVLCSVVHSNHLGSTNAVFSNRPIDGEITAIHVAFAGTGSISVGWRLCTESNLYVPEMLVMVGTNTAASTYLPVYSQHNFLQGTQLTARPLVLQNKRLKLTTFSYAQTNTDIYVSADFWRK